jgi:hypothetical protein
MLPQDFYSTQQIQNAQTGDTGSVYALVPSPYPNEEAAGIQRVMVWTTVHGSDGQMYGAWDWWLMSDCVAMPKADIPSGAFVVLVDCKGQEETALVLAAGFDQIAVMLSDGTTEWIALHHVKAIVKPAVALTNSNASIA